MITMKKSFLAAAGAALVTIAVSVSVYANNRKNETEDLFYANVEALADGEGGYSCPGACITWSGTTGGGLDCMCHRYVGRCKRWCD